MAYQSEKKPQPDPPKPKPSFDELVELNRDRVLELDARGYLPTGIAAVLHIPYAVVETILNIPAPPKKKGQ
jgi:hypothetical protein